MTYRFKAKKLASIFVWASILMSFLFFTLGGYLVIKAEVGQFLLASAWEKQLAKGQKERTNVKIQHNDSSNFYSKPWPWADFYPVAELKFEKFNVSHIVLNNDSGQALAFGPGFNKMTQYALESQNVMMISAHNDTHFSVLQTLTLGDKVTLTFKSGRPKTFKVNKIELLNLDTEQLFIETEYNSVLTDKEELVLVTCYPFGVVDNTTNFRYIVHLS